MEQKKKKKKKKNIERGRILEDDNNHLDYSAVMEPVDEIKMEVVAESDAILFEAVDQYHLIPRQEEEFELSSQIDMKPLILSSNSAYDMEAEESNDEIEVEFDAVMERIKPEETCEDSKPGFSTILDTNDEPFSICRLCTNRGNEMIDLFEGNEEYENIVEKIEECLPIVVKRNDTQSKYACRSCLDKLDFCHEFYRTVIDADKRLCTFDQRISTEVQMKEEDFCNDEGGTTATTVDNNGNNIETEADAIDAISSLDPNSEDLLATQNDPEKEDGTSDSWTIPNVVEANDRKIACRICGARFQTVKKCYIHSGIHAYEYYYPCSICDETFIDEAECNEHSLEHIEIKRASCVCNECGKKFTTQDRLEFHKSYHNSDSKPCYCDKCDKIMTSETILYQHVLNVHRRYRKYCCEVCGKRFRTKAELNADQRKHNDDRPFECEICSQRFFAKHLLSRHRKLHVNAKPHQCDQCGKRFDRTNTLTKHLLSHQAEAGNSANCRVCNVCKEVFADDRTADDHRKCTIGKKTKDRKIVALDLKEIYRCEYCQRCFTEIALIKIHRASHSGPTPYVCAICDTRYSTYSQVTAHRMGHKKSSKLKTVKDSLPIPKYFTCEYCDKRYLHFTNMNIHRRSCLKKKNRSCGHCGYAFDNARELAMHKKGKAGEKKIACNECASTFGSECAFEIHKRTHPRISRNKNTCYCSYCGKTFLQRSHLTIHVRSHTGERPYGCDLCEKTYRIKSERDNHRMTHSGEKLFKCTECDKAFANTVRLREHARFHRGNRPYDCQMCDQSFKKANARNIHMTIHTGEKPYRCDICGTNFRRNGDMRKHMRNKHGHEFETKNKA